MTAGETGLNGMVTDYNSWLEYNATMGCLRGTPKCETNGVHLLIRRNAVFLRRCLSSSRESKLPPPLEITRSALPRRFRTLSEHLAMDVPGKGPSIPFSRTT